jgi:hypothetical protein
MRIRVLCKILMLQRSSTGVAPGRIKSSTVELDSHRFHVGGASPVMFAESNLSKDQGFLPGGFHLSTSECRYFSLSLARAAIIQCCPSEVADSHMDNSPIKSMPINSKYETKEQSTEEIRQVEGKMGCGKQDILFRWPRSTSSLCSLQPLIDRLTGSTPSSRMAMTMMGVPSTRCVMSRVPTSNVHNSHFSHLYQQAR